LSVHVLARMYREDKELSQSRTASSLGKADEVVVSWASG
jgi:hypothetical protein